MRPLIGAEKKEWEGTEGGGDRTGGRTSGRAWLGLAPFVGTEQWVVLGFCLYLRERGYKTAAS